ncbi:DUF4314 domain-containing protein [Mediterraneibacter gnavus]|jgi:hypothetical protein|nr:DUF4314 domain-containing protein [Mediterraneibacter gnavus]
MNVAIYLRVNQQIEEIDECMVLWRERALLYCKQKQYIPVIIMEISAVGEAAEEYGLDKLEELFRKKCIAGIVTYDISMLTQDIKKLIRFCNVLYGHNIRMDSISQGILEKSFIKKVINHSNNCTNGEQRPEVQKNLKELFPIGSRVKLERIYSSRGNGLTMGDLGTVLAVDDTGILRIAWDILDGRPLYLHLDVDACQCIMRKEQIDKFLKDLCQIPFHNISRLEDWIALILEPAFPCVSIYRNKVKKNIFVDLGVTAFTKEKAILDIKYKVGKHSELSVSSAKIKDLDKKKKRGFGRNKATTT